MDFHAVVLLCSNLLPSLAYPQLWYCSVTFLLYSIYRYGVRVNTISAGPLASRAAKAIGGAGKPKTFIDYAIEYSKANAPLAQDL